MLMGLSYPVIGADGFALWYELLTAKLGQVKHIISPENMSLHGFVYRAFIDHESFLGPSTPWLNLGPQAAKTVTNVVIAAICLVTAAWMIRRRKVLNAADCLAAAVPVVLLMSPITWTHHGVQLLVPLAAILVIVTRRPRPSPLDLGWIVAILLCLTMWPVQRFQLELPSRISHLFAPTVTYAVVLIWLFMMVRYEPLKRAAESAEHAAMTAHYESLPGTATPAVLAAGH